MRAIPRVLLAVISFVLAAASQAGEPPTASDLRVAFEAQFPKSDANGTALELERLSARIGIDLAPKPPMDPNNPVEPAPPPKDGRARPEPGTENRLPLIEFLQRELAVTNEKIGRAAPAIEKYFDEHDGEIAEIESYLLSHEEPRWELDVALRSDAPLPNLSGLMRLQRVLLTRALLLTRRGNPEAAVDTMESSWRLQGALISRPELISHLVAIAVTRFQAGVLRKIDSPFFDWPARLRSPGVLQGVLAALVNEQWSYPGEETSQMLGLFGKAWMVFAEALPNERDCSWTTKTLRTLWTRAAESIESDEKEVISEIASPNIFNAVLRARRVMIDNELTALVLDARSEAGCSSTPEVAGPPPDPRYGHLPRRELELSGREKWHGALRSGGKPRVGQLSLPSPAPIHRGHPVEAPAGEEGRRRQPAAEAARIAPIAWHRCRRTPEGGL